MRKNIVTLLLSVFLLVGTTGCFIITEGESSWEIYTGMRAKQQGKKTAKVGIKSSVVDKIVNSLMDGEVSNAE